MSGIQNIIVDRSSIDKFEEDVANAINSGTPLIHVRTTEVVRACNDLQTVVMAIPGAEYYEWNVLRGLRQYTTMTAFTPTPAPVPNTQQIIPAMQHIWDKLMELRDCPQDSEERERTRVYNFVNAHLYIPNNAPLLAAVMELSQHSDASAIKVVFTTNDQPLPSAEFSPYFYPVSLELPGHSELKSAYLEMVENAFGDDSEDDRFVFPADSSELDRIIVAGAGMTRSSFDQGLARTIVEFANSEAGENPNADIEEVLVSGIRSAKAEAIKSSDLLELMESGNMDSVGGMDHLKQWVRLRTDCYSPEAQEFGIEAPKGLVLVGVPGTGKSLIAKAVASTFGIPLVRMDFGKMFNALLGSSESRMRSALKMIEAMAPCVCFADEIDKGLGGIGGGGDSGVSMRILGMYLTWLQECALPVFNVVTANNVNGLPPELLRRGRFDAIFSTTLPTAIEREEVFEIHLNRRGHSLDNLDPNDVYGLVNITEGYVPAEIEAIVKDALILAYSEPERSLSAVHLDKCARGMVPLSQSHREQMESMMVWAKDNATAASFTEEENRQHGRTRRGEPGAQPTGAKRTRRKINTTQGKVTSLASRRSPKKEED